MNTKDVRHQFKDMVSYLLDCKRTKDNEKIEAYTDSFMAGIVEMGKHCDYLELRVKRLTEGLNDIVITLQNMQRDGKK